MEAWHLLILFAAGIGIGFINTIAGGGSLIAIPLLMLLGIPIQVANGTNRIAILFQNITSFVTFRAKGIKTPFRLAFLLAVMTTLGAIFGAFFAARVNPAVLKWAVIALLVVMLFLTLYKPQRWLKKKPLTLVKIRAWDYPLFFAIGFYGGFIQAGAGLLVTTALVLRVGFDAITAEAVKSFILPFYTIFAVIVFVLHGQVSYLLGFALALGSMLGAWIAAKVAVKEGPKLVRYLLILVMLFAAVYLIFFDR